MVYVRKVLAFLFLQVCVLIASIPNALIQIPLVLGWLENWKGFGTILCAGMFFFSLARSGKVTAIQIQRGFTILGVCEDSIPPWNNFRVGGYAWSVLQPLVSRVSVLIWCLLVS